MTTALEYMSAHDEFAKHCGIELLEVSPGYAKGRMTILPHHLNSVGGVHGGAVFTLADFVYAAASNSHGQVSVSIAASITHTKAISSGVIVGTAKELSVSRRVGTYIVDVRTEEGELIAHFQGTVYRKDTPYPPEQK